MITVLNEWGVPDRENPAVSETEEIVIQAAKDIGRLASTVGLDDARVLFDTVANQLLVVLAGEYMLTRQTNQRQVNRGKRPTRVRGWEYIAEVIETEVNNDTRS